MLTPREGSITFEEEDITGIPTHQVYGRGIVMVPEDRGMFPNLTVRENLRVPIQSSPDGMRSVKELFEMFPRLEERSESKGKHLSGGEQQMLTIARALRCRPRLLLLDEPSEGLAPQIVQDVREIIQNIGATGTTVLLVEQNVEMVLDLASYVYIMDAGRIVFEGDPASVRDQETEVRQYLGVYNAR
jgi:branched-chain amino acid transport system ATP-binding protein